MGRADDLSRPPDAQEALLHFLYQFPVAVIRLDARGQVDLMNPRAVALLQSLGLPCVGAQAGYRLLNELDAPTATQTWAALDRVGVVASRLALTRADSEGHPRHLALTVQVVSPGSCMLTLEDLTELHAALEARRESERRFHDLIEVIPAGVVMHGPGSEIRIANAEASRLLGLSIDQLMGRDAIDPRWQFQREDGSPMPLSEFPVNQVLATGHALENFVVGIRRPGEDDPVWVIVNAIPVRSATGELVEVCVSFTDVTALKRTEQKLRVSEERYRLVLRGSNDAPWDWDLVHDSMYYSPRWWQMLGRPVDEVATDPAIWVSLLHPDDRERVPALVQAALDDGRDGFEIECRFVQPDGGEVDVLSRGFIQRDAQGRAVRVSGTNLDLRERKRTAAEIQRLAYNDPLTGLPNRRRLLEKAHDALSASSRSTCHGALLFIDLDRFKELNDTRGHACGDRLLQQVAARLLACTRESDTVARLGGDEFVVLLEHLSNDGRVAAVDAEKVGEKFLRALHEPFDVGAGAYHGAASIGITLFGPATRGVDDLLKEADLAMYRAKALGGRRVHFFDESMQAAVEQRVALEADLRAAFERDELALHYQVQVDQQQRAFGAEALVRWIHPKRGTVSPGAFIPLAEATGLILPLGRWVLHAACTQLARWAREPSLAALTLSVNVSVHQLHDPGFVDQVLQTLAQTGADPRRLKLEVTESALAQDIEQIIAKMRSLKDHGVMFALDDFGTGYSSLAYLKRLPLDEIKIDGSFVRDVIGDPNDAMLVRTIVTLAREFGVSVIAEGVETPAQHGFLAQVGCRRYQGFLFGHPQPADVFERLATCQPARDPGGPPDGRAPSAPAT